MNTIFVDAIGCTKVHVVQVKNKKFDDDSSLHCTKHLQQKPCVTINFAEKGWSAFALIAHTHQLQLHTIILNVVLPRLCIHFSALVGDFATYLCVTKWLFSCMRSAEDENKAKCSRNFVYLIRANVPCARVCVPIELSSVLRCSSRTSIVVLPTLGSST